jgi:NADPH:quinone reductase-like Zn-dependent oxidoreductase
MHAIMYDRFGDESVLSIREIAPPQPGRGEVQVGVSMASLNPIDFKLRSGILRLVGRPRRPAITGKDFAGKITALGPDAQGFAVGQRVFGSVSPLGGRGSCAQFVTLSTNLIARIPDGVSDEVAACLPVASGTALQALSDIAHLRRGQTVLITGASGAVGASGVQLARSIGARITGVCGTPNIEFVRAIGADRVIDYKTEKWQDTDGHFDVVFDAAASAGFSDAKGILNAEGIYINTLPGPALFFSALVARLTSRQRCVPFMLKTDAGLLERLVALAANKVIVPKIHEIIGLAEVGDAQRRMQQGMVHGKVCVRVEA